MENHHARAYAMTLIGYARVSTNDQDVALLLDALRDAGVARVFEDRGGSSAKSERPGLNEALVYLREEIRGSSGSSIAWAGL